MSLVRITQEIVGEEYKLGSCDCFRVVYDYLSRFYTLPREWQGLTLEGYAQVFEDDPQYAKWVVEDFLTHHLVSIDTRKAFAGDILMLHHPEHPPFPAIHAGNRHFIGAEPSRGVAVLPLRNFTIKGAWRCQPVV